MPGFQATKQTNSALKTPGFLRTIEVPKIIHDAIHLVESLGERYAWIDSLCIIQDDPIHKRLQLAQMDLTYGRALVTLIALTAFDATSGLAGTHVKSRISSRSIHYVDGRRLILKPPEFDTILEKSKYSSRAWTLQESILFPRCLWVTNHQVYYSCHGMLQSESDQAMTIEERSALSSVNWFTEALIQTQQSPCPNLMTEDWTHHFRTYVQLVSNCTSRNLSDPRDVLDATLGPLTILSTRLGPFSLAGLPDRHLDHALLWAPHCGGPRTRNDYFLSWSWAGWSCRSIYFCKPVFLGTTGGPIPLRTAIQRFEVSWQTIPRVVERPYTQKDSEMIQSSQTPTTEDIIQSWSTRMEKDPPATQILSFTASLIHCNHFRIIEKRPSLRMIILPEPTITISDKDGTPCGVLYDDFDTLCTSVRGAEADGWTVSFMLLSRTEAPELSQNLFFDTNTYERKPWCLLNVMLVKHLCDPTGWVENNEENGTQRSVTQRFERVAIGQIHFDAWEAERPVLCRVVLA